MMNNTVVKLPANTIYLFSIPALLIFICSVIYWPGLDGIFLLDDYVNLNHLGSIGGVTDLNSLFNFVFGNRIGPTGRPVSMLSFLIDDQYWPGSASTYKYTNLMLHNLCGLIIFLFIYRISKALNKNEGQAIVLSTFCSALWLLHPFNVSTTLYVVQRMTQLVSIFTLLGVLCYGYGRVKLSTHQIKAYLMMSLGVGAFGFLAFFSKENGILLAFYVLVTELTVFQNTAKDKYFKYWFGIFIGLPILVLLGFFASKGFYYSSYNIRDFTLYQRLLTESRILLSYIYSIVIPPTSGTGLIHDDIKLSTSLFRPITTLFSIVFHLTVVFLAIRLRKKYVVFSFAVLWFYAGHIMESTFVPLELYFEHRNYLPMIGPLFGMIFYLHYLYTTVSKPNLRKTIVAIPLLLLVFSTLITYQTTKIWSNPGSLFAIWAKEHPESLRAQRVFGQFLYINGKSGDAIKTLHRAYEQHPYDISLIVEMVNIACTSGINGPFHLTDIERYIRQSKYTDGVWGITNTFIDNVVKDKCDQYSIDDMIELLSVLSNMPDIKRQKAVFAKLLFLKSDLNVLQRRLTPAIHLLDEAYKYQPRVTIPLRQAELLVSARLYKDALEYIQLAKQADQYKRRFQPSEMDKILKWEKVINNAIQQNLS